MRCLSFSKKYFWQTADVKKHTQTRKSVSIRNLASSVSVMIQSTHYVIITTKIRLPQKEQADFSSYSTQSFSLRTPP